MNKKGSFWALFSILYVLLLIFLFVLISYSSQSKKMCSNECADTGTRFSNIEPNGEWFNTRDLCICYLKNGTIKSFVMDDKNE